MSDTTPAGAEIDEQYERKVAFEMALSMYAGEPCRICGRLLTMDDLKDGAKFTGYNADNRSRAAHRRCWEGFVDLLHNIPAARLHALMTPREDTDNE